MNEMNNGDNGFNNQNNVNYQEQQINYVPNTEYQDTSNNCYKEPSKKSYCGLLVVFMLISLGLAGYIVYDKAIKKEEPVNQGENNNQNVNDSNDEIDNKPTDEEENNNQNIEDSNDETDNKPTGEDENRDYFSVETINQKLNNKNAKIELKFWIEDKGLNNDDPYDDVRYIVNCDFFLNDKLIQDLGFYEVSDSKNMTEADVIKYIQENENYKNYVGFLKGIGVIKGDKDYLYIKRKFEYFLDEASILVFNDAGEKILGKSIEFAGRGVQLDKSCYGYSSFVDRYNKDYNLNDSETAALYFTTQNALVYASDKLGCEEEGSVTIYEITFNKDKAVEKEIATCKTTVSGAC